ncbi:MAG: hypothetical protein DRG31_00915 [Deltaproteobacteria bacterium]|nr:MAG: hypothetical protein DRG31_00915 [Deltaproteobacteria bacterium]
MGKVLHLNYNKVASISEGRYWMKVPLEDFKLNSNLGIYVHERVEAIDYLDGSEAHLLKTFEKVSD